MATQYPELPCLLAVEMQNIIEKLGMCLSITEVMLSAGITNQIHITWRFREHG